MKMKHNWAQDPVTGNFHCMNCTSMVLLENDLPTVPPCRVVQVWLEVLSDTLNDILYSYPNPGEGWDAVQEAFLALEDRRE